MADVSPDWKPKAVVFDLLTGLLDSWSLWDASTPTGTAAEGRPWRHRYLDITFNLPGGAYVPYEDCVRQAAKDVGLPESAPDALLRDWGNLNAWPEVGKVLIRLRQKGYRLGVVTNCSKERGHVAVARAEAAASQATGEDFVFDAAITAEESGFYKPLPQAYTALLDRMGLEPNEVLFLAGSSGDVQGATRVGMTVVWHNKAGLPKKGEADPLKEAFTLDQALEDFF